MRQLTQFSTRFCLEGHVIASFSPSQDTPPWHSPGACHTSRYSAEPQAGRAGPDQPAQPLILQLGTGCLEAKVTEPRSGHEDTREQGFRAFEPGLYLSSAPVPRLPPLGAVTGGPLRDVQCLAVSLWGVMLEG